MPSHVSEAGLSTTLSSSTLMEPVQLSVAEAITGTVAAARHATVEPASAGTVGGSVSFTRTTKEQVALALLISVADQVTVERPLSNCTPFSEAEPLADVAPNTVNIGIIGQLSTTVASNRPPAVV